MISNYLHLVELVLLICIDYQIANASKAFENPKSLPQLSRMILVFTECSEMFQNSQILIRDTGRVTTCITLDQTSCLAESGKKISQFPTVSATGNFGLSA